MTELFEIEIKTYLLKNISYEYCSIEISKLIDKSLLEDLELSKLHEEKVYMPYVMNNLYPLEKDKIYKEGGIYTFTIRTISRKVKDHFVRILCNSYTDTIKVLSANSRQFRNGFIERIYSITPILLKIEEVGYWRNKLTVTDFERLLKENLFKKYRYFFNESLDESVELYSHLQFDNKQPIAMKYKNITLLGDKLTIQVAENEIAQKIFFMALGTGLGHNNSRGMGYINAKFL